MTQVAKGIWRNIPRTAGSAASATAVEPAATGRPTYSNVSVSVQFSSAAQWPGYAVNRAPSRAFEENQRKLAHHKRMSAIFDSRLEKWCAELGTDADQRRHLLHDGYTLRFERHDTATGRVDIHTIRPEEIR